MVVGSGTMGQGDQCAPSLALENPLTLTGQTVSFGYETLAVYRLLATGAAVVVTDYVGLGATDRLHTYVNRVDEGHAMLDAARAARSVPGASVTAASRVGMYGYSQGGGASAAAAELHSTYAPEIPLAGTYSGAPPADLTEVTKGIDGSALAGALGWSINGFAQTAPALRDVVEANLNDAGRKALKDISTTCVGDAILGYGFTKSTKWTKSGKSVGEIIAGEPAAQAVLDDQRLGQAEAHRAGPPGDGHEGRHRAARAGAATGRGLVRQGRRRHLQGGQAAEPGRQAAHQPSGAPADRPGRRGGVADRPAQGQGDELQLPDHARPAVSTRE